MREIRRVAIAGAGTMGYSLAKPSPPPDTPSGSMTSSPPPWTKRGT